MPGFWMVRAGEGSTLAADFEREGCVAIGWVPAGDMSPLTNLDLVRERINATHQADTPQSRATTAGQTNKFRNVIAVGDRVVTYDGGSREYLLGTVTGDYAYRPGLIKGSPQIRRVRWDGRISKDVIRRQSVNTLGSLLTVFEPGEDVLRDLEDALRTGRKVSPDAADDDDASSDLPTLFEEFVEEYLSADVGKNHRDQYELGRRTGRKNFEEAIALADAGKDVTEFVLSKLLPHTDTKNHRDSGAWIHVAPAITKDIQSWYEGAGWATANDWPAKAQLILGFVRRVTSDPSTLATECSAFSASPMSKGLQGGMLTPILNAVRPDAFAIANGKSVKLYEALTGDEITTSIAAYPTSNAAVVKYVHAHLDVFGKAAKQNAVSPLDAFDMMSHWYVAVREPGTDGPGGKTVGRVPINRESATSARQVVEAICPDPAPRAAAISAFVQSLLYVDSLSNNAWSVTLKQRVMRLNVAGIMAIDLRRDGVAIVAHQPALDVQTRSRLDQYEVGDFKYIPHAVAYQIPYDQLDPALTLLRPAHEALIRLATEKSDKAMFKSAHSPGVLRMLRELGHAVPDPAYFGSGDTTDPNPKVHPVYTLDHAAAELFIPRATLEGWARAINRKGQAIIYGPPGTGKTYVAERLSRHLLSGGDGNAALVQFHPAYAYEDFIQGLRPQAGTGSALTYQMVPGRFIEFCREAEKRKGVSVLIIDEINRANLAEVFGELMYLLEYRDRELPLAGGNKLRIPPNVRIIGTMNTADRSIAMVDHALRRRFAFIRLDPNTTILDRFHSAEGRDVSGLISVLTLLNERIADPHYAVGISFFMRDSLPEDIEAIWRGEIEPYIEELFFDRKAEADRFRWDVVRERIAV